MGTITVVNLTDAPIQSKISNTEVIYSGINGILPHVYYHHNAAAGTYYDLTVKWYIPGIVEPFPHSDLTKIGWYIGGALLTVAGIVATVLSVGVMAPEVATAWTTFTASIGAIDTTAATAVIAGEVSSAAGTFVADVGTQAFYGAVLGGLVGVTGLGLTAGAPAADYVAGLKDRTIEVLGKLGDQYFSFTGNIPLVVSEEKDAAGKTTTKVTVPTDGTAGTPPTYERELTLQEFDMMRRKGQIYQIKHNQEGEYCDETQGYVRMNLIKGPGEKVTWRGVTAVDINKIYRFSLQHVPQGSAPGDPFYDLVAGEDEGDGKVYLKKMDLNRDRDQDPSCWFWQLIPTREGGGGWIIVDRRYVRFLYRSGSEILQYQSEETGITVGADGWAQNVTRPGMIWELSSSDNTTDYVRIEQPDDNPNGPNAGRMCITVDKDFGSLYASPSDSPDVYQQWHLEAQG